MVLYSGERKFVMWRIFLLPVLLLAISMLLFPRISDGAGPWKGRIVDAETKQPVDEVIVIGVWTALAAGDADFLRILIQRRW
jgi:hypothetical protein